MSVMAAPRKKRDAGKAEREPYNFNSNVNPDIGDAFEEVLNEHFPRVTKTYLLEVALVEFLEKRGKWPRKRS
jgi:hypothetical protein